MREEWNLVSYPKTYSKG
uniref:Uncharacterized protein n=1 Tax=Rhizophora mucronata TaxID=61149 RepID=A0A2P2PA88_RHIMU